MLFRESAPNGLGAENAHDELRDAFGGAWNGSGATSVFLEWFRFGVLIKADWRQDGLDKKGEAADWKGSMGILGYRIKLGCSIASVAMTPEPFPT